MTKLDFTQQGSGPGKGMAIFQRMQESIELGVEKTSRPEGHAHRHGVFDGALGQVHAALDHGHGHGHVHGHGHGHRHGAFDGALGQVHEALDHGHGHTNHAFAEPAGSQSPPNVGVNARHLEALMGHHEHRHKNRRSSGTELDKGVLDNVLQKAKDKAAKVVLVHDETQKVCARHQGDLDMYTAVSMEKRKDNRNHPKVLAILELMWTNCKRHHSSSGDWMDKEEYRLLHDRMVRVFSSSAGPGAPTADGEEKNEAEAMHELSPEEKEQAFEDDWEMDSHGDGRLEKDDLFDSMFQLADMWCETTDVEE